MRRHAGQAASSAGAQEVRTSGADRYETAAWIAVLHPAAGSARTAYIANGLTFADAVAAGARVGAPVLLVPARGFAPRSVKAPLLELDPDVVTALGGEGAISQRTLSHASW